MVMFELPKKGDLDRTLSGLMHDARHRVEAECDDIVSQAASGDTLQSSRRNLLFFHAADRYHESAMGDASSILLDFIKRTEASPFEIVGWARPHLENLGNVLLAVPKPHGFPEEHRRLVNQYTAVFRQRLDGVLRDVEIGYIKGEGFAPNTPGRENVPVGWIDTQSGAAELVAQLGPRPVPRVLTATIEERFSVGETVSVERRLSERPEEIREAARALSRAISEQIEDLNASKPNDPDALTRQEKFIGFMQRIAAGSDELAESLERVSNEVPASRGVLSKSAEIALRFGKSVMNGLEENRATILACSLRAPVIAATTCLLHLFGVSTDLAAGISAALMGIDVFRPGGKE